MRPPICTAPCGRRSDDSGRPRNFLDTPTFGKANVYGCKHIFAFNKPNVDTVAWTSENKLVGLFASSARRGPQAHIPVSSCTCFMLGLLTSEAFEIHQLPPCELRHLLWRLHCASKSPTVRAVLCLPHDHVLAAGPLPCLSHQLPRPGPSAAPAPQLRGLLADCARSAVWPATAEEGWNYPAFDAPTLYAFCRPAQDPLVRWGHRTACASDQLGARGLPAYVRDLSQRGPGR